MIEPLDPADLLAVAVEAFRDEIQPHLPEDARYTGLLIAAAMAVAAREATLGPDAEERELARLYAVFGEDPDPGEDRKAALRRLNRRLADDIRAGVYDEDNPAHARVYQALVETVADALSISNPRYR